MIRKHKKFSRPKKLFDTTRIKDENALVNRYGLKNKKEIWKAKTKLDLMRGRAKKLINESEEDQKALLDRLKKLGFNLENTVDVLALTEEDILKRRLQSVVFQKDIATTPKGARQLITHKRIEIDGKVVNIPSYMVKTDEENKISLIAKKKMPKVKEPAVEEKTEDVVNLEGQSKDESDSSSVESIDATTRSSIETDSQELKDDVMIEKPKPVEVAA